MPWLSGYRGKPSYLAKGTSAPHHVVLEHCHHRHVDTPHMPCSLPPVTPWLTVPEITTHGQLGPLLLSNTVAGSVWKTGAVPIMVALK